MRAGVDAEAKAREIANEAVGVKEESQRITVEYIAELEKEMLDAAEKYEFERAAQLRDRIEAMREELGNNTTIFEFNKKQNKERRKRGRRRGSSDSGRGLVPKPER